MKKFSKNIIIRVENSKIRLIQTGDTFTLTEELIGTFDIPDAYVCVESEKFLSVFDESCSKLTFNEDYLEVTTKRQTVKLPYMKEYGGFLADPEITFTESVKNSFSHDFSTTVVELEDALGLFAYVLFSEKFVARYLRNTLEFYGDLGGDYYSITPAQFKILKSLGMCDINIGTYSLIAKAGQTSLVLKLCQNVLNLQLVEKFFNAEDLLVFTAPEFNLKNLKLFLKSEQDITVEVKDKVITFSSQDISDSYDLTDCSTDYNFKTRIHKDDLENLDGLIKVRVMSNTLYFISHSDTLDRTVLFISKGEING